MLERSLWYWTSVINEGQNHSETNGGVQQMMAWVQQLHVERRGEGQVESSDESSFFVEKNDVMMNEELKVVKDDAVRILELVG